MKRTFLIIVLISMFGMGANTQSACIECQDMPIDTMSIVSAVVDSIVKQKADSIRHVIDSIDVEKCRIMKEADSLSNLPLTHFDDVLVYHDGVQIHRWYFKGKNYIKSRRIRL